MHRDIVVAVAWSLDDEQIISGCWDKIVPPVKLPLERGTLSWSFEMRYVSSKSLSRAAKMMYRVIPCSIPVFSNNDELNTKSM